MAPSLRDRIAVGQRRPTEVGMEQCFPQLRESPGANAIQQGFWVPGRRYGTKRLAVRLAAEVARREADCSCKEWIGAIRRMRDFVASDKRAHDLWHGMIKEVNDYVGILNEETLAQLAADGDEWWPPQFKDKKHTSLLPSSDFVFTVLNEIVHEPPGFNTSAMVGTPMNGFLCLAMGTKSGNELFLYDKFNHPYMEELLDAWNCFLKSPASLSLLDDKDPTKAGSWLSQEAIAEGIFVGMVHDPTKPNWGYSSWNDFFTRPFLPNQRYFRGREPDVCIGCETTPWVHRRGLARKTDFNLKTVNYSLEDIFAGHGDWVEHFVGGELYQGFLSATHYHRWNVPLDGQLVESWVQPGTYFAQRPGQQEHSFDGTESQPYLPQVAERAIFIFKNRHVGYVALVMVGMVEVSTCKINAKYQVKKGDAPLEVKKGVAEEHQLGQFEFGGSTHCMLFQNDRVDMAPWAEKAEGMRVSPVPVPMGTIIASAKPRGTKRALEP